MSETEINKGTLYYITDGEDSIEKWCKQYLNAMHVYTTDIYDSYKENFQDLCFDNKLKDKFLFINNILYKVEYEIKSDTDMHLEHVKPGTVPNSIEFMTIHYNGGGSLEEVLEGAINKMKDS